MEKREEDEPGACAICGELVDLSDTSIFRVSSSTVVCGECAHKHDGVYNAELEEWVVRPRIPKQYQSPREEV